MAATVSDVLRRFLPEFLRARHGTLNRAQRRAVWAITRCRTAAMGGHLCGCGACGILAADDHSVTFRWTDRANHNAQRTETLTGVKFVRRYLRHVLPRGMRAIRYYGFCHPAAKDKRERVAFQTGRPLLIGPFQTPVPKPAAARPCPCCGAPMAVLLRLLPDWKSGRAPPPQASRCA